MYSKFRSVLEKLDAGDEQAINFVTADSRLALAMLLFNVVKVDGRIRPEELRAYRTILEEYLQVSEDELHSFETMVDEISSSGEMFEKLVAELRLAPIEKRQEIVTMMHDISVSDYELHELELNMLSHVMRLLGIQDAAS
ncbi:MAG: TerB family tellurite resistance protein [Pseudomonadota bacterium]